MVDRQFTAFLLTDKTFLFRQVIKYLLRFANQQQIFITNQRKGFTCC